MKKPIKIHIKTIIKITLIHFFNEEAIVNNKNKNNKLRNNGIAVACFELRLNVLTIHSVIPVVAFPEVRNMFFIASNIELILNAILHFFILF